MDVLHVVDVPGERFGGLGSSVFTVVDSLNAVEPGCCLLTAEMSGNCDMAGFKESPWIRFHKKDGISPLNISRSSRKQIESSDYSIYHIHGLWQYPGHKACSWAFHNHKPYLITLHGMLYPETLKRSFWKKWPMLKIWFRDDIMRASCLHVSCETEMNHLRTFGYKGPVAVIGNPVKIESFTDGLCARKSGFVTTEAMRSRKTIGFLGRLHPRKNVEAIIRGMALAGGRNAVRLVVMGDGDKKYERFLKEEVVRLGLQGQVEFIGFVNGEEKFRRLAELSALFVPSDVENFGQVVPEALLAGTPVMASLGTPWSILDECDCGWWRDNSPESIAKVIDEVVRRSPEELFEMGMRGRGIVLEKYPAAKVAARMRQLYSWLLGEADKPAFVYEPYVVRPNSRGTFV